MSAQCTSAGAFFNSGDGFDQDGLLTVTGATANCVLESADYATDASSTGGTCSFDLTAASGTKFLYVDAYMLPSSDKVEIKMGIKNATTEVEASLTSDRNLQVFSVTGAVATEIDSLDVSTSFAGYEYIRMYYAFQRDGGVNYGVNVTLEGFSTEDKTSPDKTVVLSAQDELEGFFVKDAVPYLKILNNHGKAGEVKVYEFLAKCTENEDIMYTSPPTMAPVEEKCKYTGIFSSIRCK